MEHRQFVEKSKVDGAPSVAGVWQLRLGRLNSSRMLSA